MKSKKKLLTWLLLAVFMMTVGVAVTLLATGCGEKTEIDRPTVGTTSFVYNGAEQGITVAANDGYTISGSQKSTDAGEYTVTVSLKDKEKTKWKGAGTDDLTFTYTIAKADNAFTTEYAAADYTVGDTPVVTDAVAKFGTATVGYFSDAACKNAVAGMTGFTATTAAGTYYVKVSVSGTENYNELSKVYTVIVFNAEIEKPTVGETSFVYNGREQGISIAENDAYTIGGDQKATDAGTYTVTVSLKDKATQQWAGGGTDDLTFTYEIAQAEVTKPSATENTFVYDGNEHNIVVPESDLYTVTSAAKTDKGEYSATVALKDKNNYKWAGGDSADLTLAWTISAVANGWNAEYNTDDYTYGQTPATTAADAKFGDAVVKFYSDEACSDAIAGMTGFDAQTAAGTYYVKVTVAGNENYGALSQVYTVIVAKAEVEKPTVGNASFVYNGKAQGISIAASDLYTVVGEQTKTDAGKYSVTVALNDKDNYKWTGGDSADLTFDYTIAKATVDRPSVATTSLAYNGAEQSVFTAPADAEYTVVGNTAKSVGKHTATFTLKDTRNYEWAGGSIGEFVVEWTIARGTATVTDESELNDAIADDGYDVIKLGNDMTATGEIVFGRAVRFDLNGKTLTTQKQIAVEAEVTIASGDITVADGIKNINAISVREAAKLTLSGVDVMNAGGYGVVTGYNAFVKMDGGSVTALWHALSTNNLEGAAGYDITDAVITSTSDSAIFMSCYTTVTLTNAAVKGKTAIDMRIGDLVVNGGSIESTRLDHHELTFAEVKASGSLTDGDGSAISVRANFYYDTRKGSNAISITLNGDPAIKGAVSVYDLNDINGKLAANANAVDQMTAMRKALSDHAALFGENVYTYEVVNGQVLPVTYDLASGEVAEARVSTAAELQAAIDAGFANVKLENDITTEKTIYVKSDKKAIDLTIDLGGFTVTATGGESKIVSVTTCDLNIKQSYNPIDLTIKNGALTGAAGYNAYGILFYSLENNLKLTLENVVSTAAYGGLYSNGSGSGAVVSATCCKFASNADSSGAYLPANNAYTFKNCTFEGYDGAYIKSGTYAFIDCAFVSNGATFNEEKYNGNGADNVGGALVIDSCKGYNPELTIRISGGEFTSAAGYGIVEYATGTTSVLYANVVLEGNVKFAGYLGGVLSKNDLVRAEAGATAELTNFVNAGVGQIKLTGDFTADLTVAEGRTFALDLNGHTLTGKIVNNGSLTIKDGAGNGKVVSPTDHAIYNNGGLTVEGGIFDASMHGKAALYNAGGATVNIEGGTFVRGAEAGTPSGNGGNSWYVVYNAGTLNMTGGRIESSSGYSSAFVNAGKANAKAIADFSENAYVCGERIAVKNDDFGVMKIDGGTFEIVADAVNNAKGSEVLLNAADCTVAGGKFINNAAQGSGAQVIYNLGYAHDGLANEAVLTVAGGKFTATAGDARMIYQASSTGNVDWIAKPVAEVTGGTYARGGTAVAIADLDLKTYGTANNKAELDKMLAVGIDVITLGADIEIGKDSVVIARDAVIDLGGHTVTATSDKAAFNVNAGNVELRNGRIVCSNTDTTNLAPRLVQVTAGTSKLTMNKIDAVSTGYGIGVFTNANLELNNCNIEVEWQVIATNNQTGGAKIVVNDSTLTSRNDAAIYMSCDTDLTLTDTAVTGTTAVDFRVGKLTVVGGSLTATSAHKKMAYADITNANGTYDAGEGSAILVRGNFYYDNVTKSNRASISVSGTQINGALSVYDMNDVGKMLGGKENDIDQIDALADFFTNFTGDKYFYEVANNKVTEGAIVATAERLKAAVNDVRYGIVRLAVDIAADVVVNASTNAVLDLNGHKLTNVSGHTVTNNGTLTVTDTSGAKSGVIDNVTHAKAAVLNNVGGVFTLADGTLTRSKENGQSTTVSGGNSFYVLQNYGTANITGGAVTQNGHYSSLIENGWYDGSKNTANKIARLTISGGTFSGGLNTVKNDDWGDLTIRGGEFTNNSQAAVMNWNIAEISGGKFTVADGAIAVIVNGYGNDTMDKGQLTVTGGEFAGAAIFVTHSAATNGGTITVNAAALRDAALKAVNATVVYEHQGVKSAYVYDGNSLKAALGGDCDTIVLTADIERTGGLRIQRSVVIDFDGHTYTLNSASERRNLTAFGVDTDDNADIAVEFKNGTIESNNRGIYTDSGRVTLTDMKINAIGRALTVQETANVTIGAGSVLTANEIETVYIFGSKKDSATAAKFKPALNVYGTVVNTSADYGAIQGVGDDLSYSVINVYDGAAITANGSGDTPGIYQPQAGELNVYGGTVTGYSAIGIKSGKLNVTGGTLTGNGAFKEITTNTNGIYLDGSAIVIDSNGAYGGAMEITVNGGILKSQNAYGIREIGKTDDQTSIVSLNITGGEITGAADKAAINVRGITKPKVSVSGGTFSEDVNDFVVSGKYCYLDSVSGKYIIADVSRESLAIADAYAAADMTCDKTFVYEEKNGTTVTDTRTYNYSLIELPAITWTDDMKYELEAIIDPDRNVVLHVGEGDSMYEVIIGRYAFTDDYWIGSGAYARNNLVINDMVFE